MNRGESYFTAGSGKTVYKGRVNEIFPSPIRNVLSLDGTWDFKTDPERIGFGKKYFLDFGAVEHELKLPELK